MQQPPYRQPQMPPVGPRQPFMKAPVKRTGMDAVNYRLGRIMRSFTDNPWRAVIVAGAVAVGVALSIAIIAAGDGVQSAITNFLGAADTGQACPHPPLPNGLDICQIQQVLDNTQSLLIKLGVAFTAALVGLITWVTMGQRRRDIAIRMQQGEHRVDVITDLVTESLILCVAGGFVGVILGNIICNTLSGALKPLTLPVNPSSVVSIFPTTTILSFAATAVIAIYYATRRDSSVGL